MNKHAHISLAFFYISALLGAGFATGKELFFYFYRFGIISGTLGLIFASFLFGLSSYKILQITDKYKIYGYKNFLQTLLGKKVGNFTYTLNLSFFILLLSAMLAAFGEIVFNLTGLNAIWGNLALTIFVYCILLSGNEIISDISNFLCPVMVIGCCYLGIKIICNSTIYTYGICFKPSVLMSSVIYVSYNMLTAAAILCEQKICRLSKKQMILTSIVIGACIFISGSLCGIATLFADNPFSPLPIYSCIKSEGTLSIIYIIVLSAALITTALGNGFCLTSGCMKNSSICMIAFLLSLFGFNDLVEKGYFVFGLLGVGILFAVLFCAKNL